MTEQQKKEIKMGSFYHLTGQASFESAFGGLTAAQAAELILGHVKLSAEQADALSHAEGNGGYGLRFDPAPVGHVAFAAVGTRWTGNGGWHILVPATPECRRLVVAARRDEFA